MIVGSTALLYWYPHARSEQPADLDVFSGDITNDVDVHWDNRLIPLIERSADPNIMDPSCLLTLKVSHLPWKLNNGSWNKHMRDVIFLQKQPGVTLYEDLLPGLHQLWSDRHGSKDHIRLNKSEADFFTSKVSRVIEHDALHLLVNPSPSFLKFKSETSVMFDKDLWKVGDHSDKINCAVEESIVLALERNMHLPSAGLIHLITNCSTGQFNLFCILHFEEILAGLRLYREQFIQLSNYIEGLKHAT